MHRPRRTTASRALFVWVNGVVLELVVEADVVHLLDDVVLLSRYTDWSAAAATGSALLLAHGARVSVSPSGQHASVPVAAEARPTEPAGHPVQTSARPRGRDWPALDTQTVQYENLPDGAVDVRATEPQRRAPPL